MTEVSAESGAASLFARLANRRAARLSDVPQLSIDAFRAAIVDAVSNGRRIVALFGMPEDATTLRLIAVLADDRRGQLHVTSSLAAERYPAISLGCIQAQTFEREIAEQCGAIPEGHPRLTPLRRHPADHRPSAWCDPATTPIAEFPFVKVEGDEVHEVAVGPVHAGIIEPGHFRFQAHGEEVLSLEIALGYQHRGVESLLETLDPLRAVYVAESVAGDSVIAHASAYCGATEALARCHKSARAQSIRGVALELERVANHVGDLGAIAGDVAYQPAAAFFGRLRGQW
jgi:hypothetical protein